MLGVDRLPLEQRTKRDDRLFEPAGVDQQLRLFDGRPSRVAPAASADVVGEGSGNGSGIPRWPIRG